jgi:NADH dehydrogenase
MTPRIFVTGASGFLGKNVIAQLLSRDYAVKAMVHNRKLEQSDPRVTKFNGTLDNVDAMARAMEGCVAVVHLVGIIREVPEAGATFEKVHVQGTKNVVAACKKAGIQRIVYVSALGTGPGAETAYHQTKFQAEETIRSSGLDWTIFRPSLILGKDGEFTGQLIALSRGAIFPYVFMPYFTDGCCGKCGKVQPAHVDDVTRAIVDSLESPKQVGEIIPIAGPDAMRWNEFFETFSKIITGSPKKTVPMPALAAKGLALAVPVASPFTTDMVKMSLEDNICSLDKFKSFFPWSPRPLEETIKALA